MRVVSAQIQWPKSQSNVKSDTAGAASNRYLPIPPHLADFTSHQLEQWVHSAFIAAFLY